MKLKEKFNEKKAHGAENKVKEKKPLKQRIRESMNGKYLRNGSYSVMISADFYCDRNRDQHDRRMLCRSKYTEFDVSSQKLYSIGDETKSLP